MPLLIVGLFLCHFNLCAIYRTLGQPKPLSFDHFGDFSV